MSKVHGLCILGRTECSVVLMDCCWVVFVFCFVFFFFFFFFFLLFVCFLLFFFFFFVCLFLGGGGGGGVVECVCFVFIFFFLLFCFCYYLDNRYAFKFLKSLKKIDRNYNNGERGTGSQAVALLISNPRRFGVNFTVSNCSSLNCSRLNFAEII